MKKKLISMLLCGVMAMSMLVGCGADKVTNAAGNVVGNEGGDEESYCVTMAYYATPQQDTVRIQNKLNEQLAADGMNFTVELMPLAWGNYDQQISLMLSGGDKLDLFITTMWNVSPQIRQEQIADMSPYMAEHSDNIVAAIGEDAAYCGQKDGLLFGVPSTRDTAVARSLVIRKDVADACGITEADVQTLEDLEVVFSKIKEQFPDMIPTKAKLMDEMLYIDSLSNNFGVLLNGGTDNTDVVNLIETDEYARYCNIVRDWYNKDYVSKDAATEQERNEDLLSAGRIASYVSHTKPGYSLDGVDIYVWDIVKPYTTTSLCMSYNWSIAANAEDPEKVMEFLNYAYGSPEFNNLIIWGEEGVDYKIVDAEKGIINYADGVTAENATYHDDISWEMPNESIAYTWEGKDPEIWTALREFNLNAAKSQAYGFIYDDSAVVNEITALSNVYEKYYNVLQTGSVDPAETIPKFIGELKAAGIDKVVEDKQRQLDEWLAAKENN